MDPARYVEKVEDAYDFEDEEQWDEDPSLFKDRT